MRRLLSILTISILPFSATAATLDPFSDFFVFGDSLSDAGNAFLATGGLLDPGNATPPNPPYQNGQFTNGDTWAKQLGALPFLSGGQNFAVGDAKAITDGIAPPDLAEQIATFEALPIVLGPNPLAAILVGANDVKTVTSIPEALALFTAIMGEIATSVTKLTARGIDRVALVGLPNLGRFPEVVGTPGQGFATAGTGLFNDALRNTAATFGDAAVYVDIFSPLEAIFAMPGDYGIADTTTAFCPTPVTCQPAEEDSNTYFFFDNVHPTEPVHTVIADTFYSTVTAPVPLPGGGVMMASALAGVVLLRRRKAAA